MDIRLSAPKIELPTDYRQVAFQKLGSLEDYFDGILHVDINIRSDKHHHTGDIIYMTGMVHVPGSILRAEVDAPDVVTALDQLQPKLIKQLKKYTDQIQSSNQKKHKRFSLGKIFKGLVPASDQIDLTDEEEIEQTQNKLDINRHNQVVKVLSETEAIHEVETSPIDAIVYKDVDTNRIRVILKREAGRYQIIDTNLA